MQEDGNVKGKWLCIENCIPLQMAQCDETMMQALYVVVDIFR